MRKDYDFSKSRKNPYAKGLKQQITIRLDPDSIRYFKDLAEETGISYQNLIDLYLKDCAREQRRLSIKWLKMG
ncbi:MAG TPA: BrnA antitoxin family protein [Nitrospira sp.]|nr:BrnA antitoxin family protein [Nitrospira sp.]